MYDSKGKMALSIFWLLLGASLLILSIAGVIDSAVYAGFGGGLLAVGVLQILKKIKYKSNPEYKEQVDTQIRDERNSFLRMKSWSWTGYILILANGLGTIAAMIAKQEFLMRYFSFSVCFIMVVYWIVFLVVNKKY